MLGYIDWIIILIALMAAIGAVLLLYPLTTSRESQQLRVMRLQAENDQRRIADVLDVTQRGAQDSEKLMDQLQEQLDKTNRSYQASQARIEQAERILERVTTAEQEMRDISSQLGDRLQHLQGFWDEQLGDSVESVKRIRSKLHEGLTQVDDSLTRLRDQEKMAQGFTRKLIEHHQDQVQNQQENSRLSEEVHLRLEAMHKESGLLLEQMKRYQQDADAVFQKFTAEMEGLESQANQHFSTLYQTTDIARQEFNAGLEESRHHLETMRRREEQSSAFSRSIQQQFEQIDHIRVERIAKALDVTEQMSTDLQNSMNNARDMLTSLEQAVQGIAATLGNSRAETPDAAALPETEAANAETGSDQDQPDENPQPLAEAGTPKAVPDDAPTPHNLVSLRAYR